MGVRGLTISRSRRPFRTAYMPLFFQAQVQPDCYARAARMNQCFILFVGSVCSMCNDAQSRLAYQW